MYKEKFTIYKENNSLDSYCEIIGILKNIIRINHSFKLYFEIEKQIDIPTNSVNENHIINLTGKKIGIINIDGKYNIRLIKDVKNNNSKINKITKSNKTIKSKSKQKNNKKTSLSLDNNLYKRISTELDDFLKKYEYKKNTQIGGLEQKNNS